MLNALSALFNSKRKKKCNSGTIVIYSFYIGKQNGEKLSNLRKVTQLEVEKAGFELRYYESRSHESGLRYYESTRMNPDPTCLLPKKNHPVCSSEPYFSNW